MPFVRSISYVLGHTFPTQIFSCLIFKMCIVNTRKMLNCNYKLIQSITKQYSEVLTI